MPTGSSKVKKTGQINSYNEDGAEVNGGTIKDDGYYKKGVPNESNRYVFRIITLLVGDFLGGW